MRSLREITDLKDKKVLLRVDFDVPVSDEGQIEETFRIKKQKETINYLVERGAKVVMVAHISDKSVDQSFSTLMPQLHILLGCEINFLKTVSDIGVYLENYAGLALLENIRKNIGEKENDSEFALSLSKGFDVYVNNDFAVCHRNHASVSGINKLLPNYAGFVVEEEVASLSRAVNSPKEGKIIIIGGAKAENKIPVIKNFLDKADRVLVGGVVANDILKEKGYDIGSSIVDENSKEFLSDLDLNSPQLIIPKDFNISENKILDIGRETIKDFSEIIKNAKTIIWNGPMGLFEDKRFVEGTRAIAQAVADSDAFKVVGGGDTISAIGKFGLGGKFDFSASSGQVFVSTGGGAMLAFLSGDKLPGLEALEN